MIAFSLIMLTMLAIVATALITLAQQERMLTLRRAVAREAVNAAECTLNYGIAQIVNRTDRGRQITRDLLSPGLGTPLAVPGAGVLNAQGFANISPQNITITGGKAYRQAVPYLIPLGDPTQVNDPFKGMTVTSSTIPILVAITSPVTGSSPVMTYAQCDLVVRDAGLFNYAMFVNEKNMDFSPGAPMTVSGPIFCNQSINLGGNSATNVQILGSLRCAGSINGTGGAASGKWYIAYKDANNNGRYDANSLSWSYDSGSMVASVASAELASLIGKNTTGAGTSSFIIDSKVPNWQNLSTLVSNGNMQDKANGVQPVIPSGLPSVAAASLINQPPLSKGAQAYDPDVESLKYSNKAGFYIVVEPDGCVSAFQNAADASVYKAVSAGNPAAQRILRDKWKEANASKVLVLPDAMVSSKNSGTTNLTSTFYDKREKKTVNAVDVDVGVLRASVDGSAPPLVFADGSRYALDTPSGSSARGWNGVTYIDVEAPKGGWMPTTSGVEADAGNTLTSVRIFNAKTVPNRAEASGNGAAGFSLATNTSLYTVGSVNADGLRSTGSGNMPDSGNPSAPGTETSVSLVADGITVLSSTWEGTRSRTETSRQSSAVPIGSVTHPDGSTTAVVSCTPNPDGTYSVETVVTRPSAQGVDNKIRSWADPSPAAVYTEISAALMMGTGPSNLEDWEPDKSKPATWTYMTIRGAQMNMFSSVVATPTVPYNQWVYWPPNRDYGLAELFKKGAYPPGTPLIRGYRRLNYRLLTYSEYAAELKSLLADGSGAPKYAW